ncbi:proline and serine-rich protein 3 [Erpetoichthys calabaricus]|uniref:proline and serine-rich protein 3 n=1 Tax=Erpetoichthys calabaricus TaxID=27687 RepID=UPI00109EE398|nr:proline and serine-rich protein 3 [Erpetoichthys calabaricus]XP_028679025.1 proline and serine-rich protein 3 [Erpetoichthys calabaricus]
MKSSGVLFSKRNPFPEKRTSKSHYNPSKVNPISKQQRKTALSPVRLLQHQPLPTKHQSAPLAQAERPVATDSQHKETLACDDQASYDEAWPSTEISSSLSPTSQGENSSSVLESSLEAQRSKGGIFQTSEQTSRESVLAKYIERFRHGRPQSREEREQNVVADGKGGSFWWLGTSPPSNSTPTSSIGKVSSHSTASLSPPGHLRTGKSPLSLRGRLGFMDEELSPLKNSDTSLYDPEEPEILQLQEKAKHLVQRSHTTISVLGPVSSNGLGSSDISFPIPSDEPERRPEVPSFFDTAAGGLNLSHLPTTSMAGPALGTIKTVVRPEEDILYQWRLRRKLELARENSLPILSRRDSYSPPVRLSEQGEDRIVLSGAVDRTELNPTRNSEKRENVSLSVSNVNHIYPIASPSLEHKSADVPPHHHLLCDVLPCPHEGHYCSLESKGTVKRMQHLNDTLKHSMDCSSSKELQQRLQRESEEQNSLEINSEEHLNSSASSMLSDTFSTGCAFQEPRKIGSEDDHRKFLKDKPQDLGMQQKKFKTPRHLPLHETMLTLGMAASKNSVQLCTPKDELESTMSKQQTKAKDVPARDNGNHKPSQKQNIHGVGLTRVHGRNEQSKPAHDKKRTSREVESTLTKEKRRPRPNTERDVNLTRKEKEVTAAPSPLRRALEQVVSERLFSPPDSPSHLRSQKPLCPPEQSNEPAAEEAQPPEIITQLLLQDAEDSDGAEFEDDPLLQVLRQQRDWVNEQLSEVEAKISEYNP